ncbi:MAG: hypothetical protein KGN78_13800 [Actinomycetales bacterium]|nr:hypothetical protein [Actinomycetales bacterium]
MPLTLGSQTPVYPALTGKEARQAAIAVPVEPVSSVMVLQDVGSRRTEARHLSMAASAAGRNVARPTAALGVAAPATAAAPIALLAAVGTQVAPLLPAPG